MLKKAALTVIVLIALFLGYIAMQPSHYVISRSVSINAPVSDIFPLINNPKQMNSWNPWVAMEPTTPMTYSGPESGVNARADWTDGKQLGTGSATIVESVAESKVVTRVEFTKPQAMLQYSEITLIASNNQTKATWTVSGNNGFVPRLFCFFMNMEKMVGGTMEKGLQTLKTTVESQAVSQE
ncbi:transcriptional regulator [bacterium]|nr:transcriptional regulator [bacterium]